MKGKATASKNTLAGGAAALPPTLPTTALPPTLPKKPRRPTACSTFSDGAASCSRGLSHLSIDQPTPEHATPGIFSIQKLLGKGSFGEVYKVMVNLR